jgi:hypothetical protein
LPLPRWGTAPIVTQFHPDSQSSTPGPDSRGPPDTSVPPVRSGRLRAVWSSVRARDRGDTQPCQRTSQ